jgi:hypothetical protein
VAAITITRLVVSAVGVAGVLAIFLLARGRFVRVRGAAAIALVAWWLSPLAYYDWRVETLIAAALIGAVVLAVGGFLLAQIYRSKGSTAAVGLFIAPVLIWLPLVLAVELDRALVR